MKICVFSDSHGNAEPMITAIEQEQPQLVFFLGDGARDLEEVQERFPGLSYYAVRGNCDLWSSLNATISCELGGVRIFAAHGHQYQVKYESSLATLTAAARKEGAAAALFGHTHEPYCAEHDGILLFNPGSVRRILHPCYGVLNIEDGKLRAELKTL